VEWIDEGLVLSRRRLGENDAVVALFTAGHGRHLGVVRGGAGRRHGGTLQPGNVVSATWRARLSEQLGTMACELRESVAARLLDDPPRLEALAACLELLDAVLPERQPHPELHAATRALLGALDEPGFAASVVRWELGLLTALGFGLDLSACAATGETEGLAHVSPRSGRAVSREAGRPFAGRLLALPAFLLAGHSGEEAGEADIATGLALTGHFIERHLLAPASRTMPPARARLVDRATRAARLRGP
jgi:DNA repair protein RecO (recombination protein O)